MYCIHSIQFEIKNRRDRYKHGGELTEFFRKGFIGKKVKDYKKLPKQLLQRVPYLRKVFLSQNIQASLFDQFTYTFDEFTNFLSEQI